MVKEILYALGAFIHENAGRLMVLSVFVFLLLMAHHAAHMQNETDFQQFCVSKSGEAFAAFLGLITGAALAKKNDTPSPGQ